jgi:photosystem II stability/assembly factor-like uncharacterized protein
LKNETILYKKNRRANGWAKPDKPSEFLKYHNSIRTKAGDSKPNYPNNYKIKELKKALNNNTLLKSSTLELDWIERGPGNCSGRTRGLIIDPSDNSRNTWYTGSVGGGIWKTTNAGESWKNLTTNLPNLSTVSLAMPKSNTNIIYAGTGEGFYNSDAISGNGIFKSIDKGETWEQLESTTSNSNFSFVNRIVVDPNNEAIVLAATNTSIQKSIDGGTTWLTVFDDDSRIQHIIAHPSDFSILYASVNAGGVIKSTDAGETWRYIFEENTGRIELAIAPSEPETIYALNENSQLYISYNSGSEWSPAKVISGTKEQFLSDQGWYNNAINVSPDNPNLLVIGGVNLYKVEIIGTSSSTTSFINIKAIGTSSFMEFINHGADYLYGSMDVNSTKKNYTNIEVQFGPGKAQMAHRFVVPRGETSGVDAIDYTYTDYVEVPFEVWDVENNRQLMVSFRDQDRNNKFNLAPFDDNELTGREYIWINDIDYSTTASGLISVNGGHEYEEIITWWSVLADGATWDDKNLPESKIKITRTDVFQKELSSKKIADWAGLGAPYVHADLHNIQFTKTQNGDTRIIVANDGGVGYSDDLGDTWTNPTNGYNTTQFYGVDKHPTSNRYTGGLQDNGSWLSPENPNNLSKWEETTGGDGFDGVWHAIDPNRIITTIYYNSLNISNDGGNTWGGLGGFADEGSGNAPFITQIGYSPTSPDKLYIVGKSGVTVSDDFGNSWTLSAIEKANWGWTGNGFVEPSIANPEVVWAGSQMSEEGQIQLSTDGGKTFNSTNNSIEEMGSISGIATHPLDENIAYALFSFNDFAKILRTTNMGDSWEDISGFDFLESNNGFPNVAVYSLLIMPHNPEIIWVGTEIGLFISNNNGLTWNYANNGLPAVSIWELKIRGNQVIAATHGRGIWTVDIPEIALALKAPILIDVATSPTNETLIKF